MSASTDLPAAVRGFILQPTYRVIDGRAVVHLFGRLEGGGNFLVRDGALEPYFYVREDDARRAGSFGADRQEPSDRVTLDTRRPVTRVLLGRPQDTPALRDRLHEHGIRTYEADVPFARRRLIDLGVRGALEIRGEPVPHQDPGFPELLVFDDPHLSPTRFRPDLSVLSVDIETDMHQGNVLSIGLHSDDEPKVAEVLLWTPEGTTCPEGAVPFATERDLLAGFAHRVREIDPDVLTGWNFVDFDLAVLDRRANFHGVPLELGRLPGAMRLRPLRSGSGLEASIPGRVVLDGIQLLRSSFVRMESAALNAVAKEVLGEGKTMTGPDRGEEILRTFHEERERFVTYNLTDARLVTEILDRLQLVELAVERSLLTGLPIDRVSGSIAAFDVLYLSALGERGVVAPSVGGREVADTAGGHVLDPLPGLYENVLVFDFQSLYPSLIRTFQIDPLGQVDPYATPEEAEYLGPGGVEGEQARGGLLEAPNGALFRREPGILPRLLDDLFPRRAAAKKAGDDVASYAIKILMNSFYGVLGTPACRFYDPRLANAITSFGRTLLLWTRDRFEELGYSVLYGDTDSLFVASGVSDPAAARALGEELVERLNGELATHIEDKWGVDSRMRLEFEKLYLKLLLPSVRGGGEGARKRYAGLVAPSTEDGEPETVFTGLEVVRRDWTDMARGLQRRLYERLFREEPVVEHLADSVKALRAGRMDDQLIYRKALRKDLSEYTSTTPPHVAAARKMKGEPGRLIEYVMTAAGPEPAEERESPLDYEHYVDKQVRPIAEPVLEILGRDFRKVIGDDKQLDLF